MNTRSYSAYTRTSQSPIIEHTPVKDLAAHQLRHKQIQKRKKIIDTLCFIAFVLMTLVLLKI
ncbi:hypothetical protein FPL17_17380 [Acinetobacter dispersus]|nr:hypothetical protein FPL17_17380 [Acinetobacter dispersus]